MGGKSKRLLDLVAGSFAFVFTLPVLFIAAAALKSAGAKPVFATEPRLGFRGKTFIVVELAPTFTGPPAANATGVMKQGSNRRTRLARVRRYLRDSGIHKLPRLVNVIRGEMSLVGPRALHPSEASRYGEEIEAYLAARPGLVQPRKEARGGALRAPDDSSSDLEYVRSWRFSTDVIILVQALFASRGR